MNRMTISSSSSSGLHLPQHAPAAARLALRLLQRLQIGSLDVQYPDGSTARFGQAPDSGSQVPRASLHLHNWQVCTAAMKSGDIGFAEGYINGDWSTSDLTAFVDTLKQQDPSLEARQSAGRAIQWDRKAERHAQAEMSAGRVAQRAYPYQTQGR